jgi:hypothetical protein
MRDGIPGPAPRRKVCRAPHLISDDGAVSALCFAAPRAIDLRRATWTNRREAVTCPKCRRLLAALTPNPKATE